MKKPFNLVKWLGNIPGWVKASFSFIGVIAAFIVAFRENWYLYTTIIVIVILAYILGTSIYILLKRLPTKSKRKKGKYQFEKRRSWGFAGLAIVCLSIIGLLVTRPTREVAVYAFLGTPTPIPPPKVEKADVLIAEFDSRYATRIMDVAHRLETDLQKRLQSFNMSDVNVQVLAQPVASESEAQTAANDTGSKVVIWGWYDDAGIQVRVFLSGGKQPGNELSGTSVIPLVTSGDNSSDITFIVRDVLPENVSFLSLFVIGHLEYLSNNYEAGHRAFDAAMNNMPTTVTIENEAILHFFQARELDAAGADISDVICEYAKAVESDPGFAEPYNNLGIVISRLYSEGILATPIPSGARACLRKAGLAGETDLIPDALYQRAFDIDPKLTIAEYNKYAFEWRNNPVYSSIYENSFKQIQEKDPSIIGTYIILGVIKDNDGDYADAIKMYEEGLRIDPNSILIHFNLGQLYLSYKKENTKAENEFRTVLSINPKYLEASLAIANLHYRENMLDEASNDLDLILKSEEAGRSLDSLHWDAHVLQSALLFNQNKTLQAIQALDEILQRERASSYEYFMLGLLYQYTSNNEKAIDSFRSAYSSYTSYNDTSRSAWEKLLETCYANANYSGAFEDWAMNDFASSGCLPSGLKAHINGLYEIYSSFITGRRIITPFVEQGMACPYVYTYDSISNEWKFQTTILYKLVGKEEVQTRPLFAFNGRLLIREKEHETSYINRLYIIAQLSDGSTKVLEPKLSELEKIDANYVILHQGDEILIELNGYPLENNVNQWWVVASGFYIPIK